MYQNIFRISICLQLQLTHLPLDKMAAISQTIFSDAFSWMKSFVFWLKSDWNLYNWQWLALNRRQAIIWSNVDPVHWGMYAALGRDELIHWDWVTHMHHWTGSSLWFIWWLVIPPFHWRWNGGILDSPRCLSVRLSVRPSVRPSVCRQGLRNFLKKLLAEFISYLAFTLMGWVSWPLYIFVFLASFSALWWPNIWPKMGFPELLEKTIGSIHFIPVIYPYGGSFLTPIQIRVPSFIFGPLVAKYLAENGVSGTFYPAALKGSGVLSSPERAGGQADKPHQHPHIHNFSRIIFKLGKDIYCPKILDEFDHRGSALLNMCKMDHLMSRTLWTFLNSFFKLKSPNFAYR